MIHEKSGDLNSLYHYLIARVHRSPEFVSSPRGMLTHEVINGNFTLTDPRARLITSPARAVNYRFAVGEFIWYWRGLNDLPFIRRYNSRLANFSDDGETLNSAYGRRIFGPRGHGGGGLSQWSTVRDILREDPDSRRAVIHILTAADVCGDSRDVPCTCTLQFLVRDGRLHLHVHMRSNDVFWGLPYDVFSFTLMQEAMAIELGVELGHYHHTAGSLHIYERHFADAEAILAERPLMSAPMPALTRYPEPAHDDGGVLRRLWRACEAEAYVSTKQPIPDTLRPPKGSGEEWLIDRLLDKWGPADGGGE